MESNSCRQHGVVHLEQEAGVDDPLVLLVERVGDRVDELLLGRVVLVAQPVDARGRDDRQEDVRGVHASSRPPRARTTSCRSAVGSYVIGPVHAHTFPRASPSPVGPPSPGTSSTCRTRFFTSRANWASCSA